MSGQARRALICAALAVLFCASATVAVTLSQANRAVAAAKSGDIVALRQMLREHPWLARATDLDGRTPLHYAALNGDERMVRLLLARGADRFAKDEAGWTPLRYAIARRHRSIIKLLRSGLPGQLEARR
jgi:ankyrin repeat protein